MRTRAVRGVFGFFWRAADAGFWFLRRAFGFLRCGFVFGTDVCDQIHGLIFLCVWVHDLVISVPLF